MFENKCAGRLRGGEGRGEVGGLRIEWANPISLFQFIAIQDLMQEIPRAILLPPPNSQPPRNSARGALALDHDLPENVTSSARRSSSQPATSFLTLIESPREDTVEFKGKQFRFRPYTNRGATGERASSEAVVERRGAGELADAAEIETDRATAAEVLDGFASGARSRNSAAFLASFIAQERLSEGLYNPAYAEASDAYRRAGGSPPTGENQPRLVSFAA